MRIVASVREDWIPARRSADARVTRGRPAHYQAWVEEIIREALSRLASATQSHRGCAEFKLYESAATPGTFVTVETWESQDDHDAHMQTEDIAAALAAAEGHVVGDIAIHPLRPV